MRLAGARVALSPQAAVKADLWITRGRVYFSPIGSCSERVLDLSGFLILPGLINAHDHLELNLFPNLGRGVYPNAGAWAAEIYRPQHSPIKEHLAVSKSARLRWGGIKNLISGVTTVAHHNPGLPADVRRELPVRVLHRYGWAHSLRFSPDWQRRFESTPRQYPFFIHAAEGTDEASRQEIHALARAAALTSSTVLIHGIAIGPMELPIIVASGSSLVWCPSSNQFTLGKTLGLEILNCGITIALGSDSAITAKGDLLDELRFVKSELTAERLYAMVTSLAARILKLPAGFGEIRDGGPADLLVIRDEGLTPAESLLCAVPKLVVVRGRIELVAAVCGIKGLEPVFQAHTYLGVEGRGDYLLSRPIESLRKESARALRQPIKLCGREVSAWKM